MSSYKNACNRTTTRTFLKGSAVVWIAAAPVFALLSAHAVGQAAEPPASGEASPAADQTQALEEVVVTAERRAQDLQKAPVAVSVRQGSELQSEGRFSVNQILEDVPSVSLSVPYGTAVNSDIQAPNIIIRGVSSNGAVPGSITAVVPAIAEYVDGIYNGLGGSYDIDQVEVLRGPQGTLYGRSATGGVVNVHTNAPTLGQFGGDAAVELGDYGLRHYTGAVNLPAGDVLALRLSGNHYERSGYYSPVGGRTDTTDGRLKLLFKPNDQLSALVGIALENNREYSGQNQGTIEYNNTVNYDTVVPIGNGEDQTRQYWAQFDWNFGAATLTWVPALHTWNEHALLYGSPSPGNLATFQQRTPYDQFHTEELRLSSNPGSRLTWQTGVFYYDNSLHNTFDLNITGNSLPPNTTLVLQDSATSRSTRNLGLFFESTYPLTDATRLTTGVRYDYTMVQTAENDCSGLPPIVPLACVQVSPQQGLREWHNFTYKARLEHDLTPSNLLYASVASAFLPGDVTVTNGPNNGALIQAPYEPETLTSFELGSKNRLLENRLQVNGDLFFYHYGAQQQAVQVGSFDGTMELVIADSPADVLGAELEVLWQPTGADRLGVNVSYIDPYYVNKPAVFVAGVAQSHLPGIIPWTIDPSYSHTFVLPHDQTLVLNAEGIFHSYYDTVALTQAYFEQGLQPYVHDSDEVTGNLYLIWNLGSRLSVSGYVRNVANNQYKTFVSLNPTTAPGQAVLSDPRTYGAVVSVKF